MALLPVFWNVFVCCLADSTASSTSRSRVPTSAASGVTDGESLGPIRELQRERSHPVRFVLAIVLFLCALGATGLGIAQRTVLAGPDQLIATGDVTSSAPVTVIDGAVLNAHPGNQSLTIDGDSTVFAAYGRTVDVLGWVGDAKYNKVSIDKKTGDLVSKVEGSESEVPTPAGSDLWLDEKTGDSSVYWPLKLDKNMSIIVVNDGAAAAPGDLRVRWPLDNSAPYSSALIVGGLSLLVVGLLVFIWALVHARRRRGPRRKQPRLPRAPRPPRLTAKTMRALPAGPSKGRRRTMIAIPILGGALILAGCTTGTGAADPTPSSSAAAAAADLPPVAVTKNQLTEILARVSTTIADADAALDPALAATRLSGPALEVRQANYTLRAADGAIPAEPAIPTSDIRVVLPQQKEGWPRTVFVVTKGEDEKVAPLALMLSQDDPRSQYRVAYSVSLQPGAAVPLLAPTALGAPRLDPAADANFALAPAQLAADYGNVLLVGEASPSWTLFDESNDVFLTSLQADKAARAADPAFAASAGIEFTNQPGDAATIVFGTNDAGAIVTTEIEDFETVKPKEAGAAINPTGQVKILSGKAQTTKGIVSEFTLQLLFYVPPVTDPDGKIVLLGSSQGIVWATEVP